ncbi:MAG: rhodanese-like domain-containing protein [Kofleriaceae bacterium]
MRTLVFAFAIAAAAATGCSKSDSKPAAGDHEANVATISVDQLDTMLAKNECQAVDANGEGTRKKLGVIPGAVLLSDSDVFNPKELPADKSKTLVFYCANTQCGASHEAAGKAITAGYQSVKVLPDGIAGWVKAGKKTNQI